MTKPQWKLPMAGMRLWRLLVAAVLLSAAPVGAEERGAAVAGAPSKAAETPAATGSRQEAAALLKGMAEYLAGLQSFSVMFRAGYDVVQSSGQKIEFGETRRLVVARPDRLRMDEVASDGKTDRVLFDGRVITVLDADAGVYAQAPQPGSIDDTLGYFVRDLRMRMPLALLMTTRLPSVLAAVVKSIDYVESTEILGVPTRHIAGRTENVDFQFWIKEGTSPLPLRVVITYRLSPGQPQFWANFADWNVSPQLSQTTFEFAPLPSSKQIPFAVQVSRSAESNKRPGANGEIEP